MLLGRLERLPAALRRTIAGRRRQGRNGDRQRCRAASAGSRDSGGEPPSATSRTCDRHGLERQALYTPEFAAVGRIRRRRGPARAVARSHRTRAARPAARGRRGDYLPGDLLAKIDIATMAYSLEARSPLLDHEFMEFAASLPPRHKASGCRARSGFGARCAAGFRTRSSTLPSGLPAAAGGLVPRRPGRVRPRGAARSRGHNARLPRSRFCHRSARWPFRRQRRPQQPHLVATAARAVVPAGAGACAPDLAVAAA